MERHEPSALRSFHVRQAIIDQNGSLWGEIDPESVPCAVNGGGKVVAFVGRLAGENMLGARQVAAADHGPEKGGDPPFHRARLFDAHHSGVGRVRTDAEVVSRRSARPVQPHEGLCVDE